MTSNFQRSVALLFAVLVMVGTVVAQQRVQNVPVELIAYPDTIFYNGKVVSMDDASLNNSIGTIYQAIAIRNGRIEFLGTTDQILAYAGPQTKKFDLKGRTLTPGLINSHSHLHDYAVSRWAQANPDKVEAIRKTFTVTGKTYDEITKGIELVVKEQMAHPLPGQWAWINLPGGGSGQGIGVQYLMKNEMTREQLDKLAPQLPVFVGAHPAFLWNTAARNSFLDWYEVNPTDENEQKAITIDTTMGRSLIADFYFDKHLEELADVIQNYLSYQAVGGFTTFSSHIVALRKSPAYSMLVHQGRMPIRFAFSNRFCQQVEPDVPGCFLRAGDFAGLGDDNDYFWNVGITLGGIDNGPPAICTTMEAPPEDKAKEQCILQPGNDYARAIYAGVMSRYRFVVNHSWGDKGIDYVMDIVDQVLKDNPDVTLDFIRSRRMSSDHCGFYPRAEQLPRMRRLGWMVSCSAGALSRSAPYLKIYGADKAAQISPIKSIIDAGVMVVNENEGWDASRGTARPVHLGDMPLLTRKNRNGDVIAPQEAIDRNTLFKMQTVWPSYYVLKEKQIGTLEQGKLADLVVWNKDYFTVPQDEIPTVYPLMTVLGGKTMVLREELATEWNTAPVGHQSKFVFTPGGGFYDDNSGNASGGNGASGGSNPSAGG